MIFFLTRLAPMERSGETLIVHIKLILIEFVFNRALRNRFAELKVAVQCVFMRESPTEDIHSCLSDTSSGLSI